MQPDRAGFLVRSAFQPQALAGLGVAADRLQAFVCDQVLPGQSEGLALFLKQCALFKRRSDDRVLNLVILGFSHEGDSTNKEHCAALAPRGWQSRFGQTRHRSC